MLWPLIIKTRFISAIRDLKQGDDDGSENVPKKEFASFQTLSCLGPFQFVKYSRFLVELNS